MKSWRKEGRMKDWKTESYHRVATAEHSNDEFLNNLLKTSFDNSNLLRDESSLDIDLSACVTIGSNQLSADFWCTLDDTAQSGLDLHTTPVKKNNNHVVIRKSPSNVDLTIEGSKKPKKKKEVAPAAVSETTVSSNKKSDLENNENSSHKPLTSTPATKTDTPFSEIFNVDNLESAGIRFKYKCQHCSILLNSFEEFTDHEKSHKILFKCLECNKEFENESGFKKHAKTHFRGKNGTSASSKGKEKQECPDCGKCLKIGSMWMHRKIHSDNKPYGCDICGQKFVQKINLTNHAKIHSGEKPFECPECQKTFPEKSHLLRHQKYHNSSRPYRCEKCGKMYKTERCLKVHNLVHLEQRPFVCQVCSKRFISNSKLKQHFNIHTGERPYKCNYCSRDFTNFPNWLKHTRRRHKVDHKTGELLEKIPSYCSKPKQPKEKKDLGDTQQAAPVKKKIKKKDLIKNELPEEENAIDLQKLTKKKTLPEGLEKHEHKIKEENIEVEISPTIISASLPTDVIIKKENANFDEFLGLSLNSFEEYLMEQTLELEEARELHHNQNAFCSLDSSPFSSPASIEIPSSYNQTIVTSSVLLPTIIEEPPSNIINSFYTTVQQPTTTAASNQQTLPSVEILLNATNFLKNTKDT